MTFPTPKSDAKVADTKVADAKVPEAKATDTKATDTKATEAKATDTKATDAKADAAPRATVTPAARAEYHLRLGAGRKLAKAQKWAEAIVALDAALVAIPGDDRALGELSWAAFSAGDYKRAREAATASVRAATAPKVKGAALYNLGRAEEASGNLAAARAAYEDSIAVRPNKTVQQRLAGLAATAVAGNSLPCATPAPEASICACLTASIDPEDRPPPEQASCTLAPAGVPDFQIARYMISEVGEENLMIVGRQADGWAVVEQLGSVYNPGMAGISEEWTTNPAVESTVGGRAVIKFTGHNARSDSDLGLDELEFEDTDVLVVCVRGQAGAPIRCPVNVVTDRVYVRESMGMAESDDAEIRAMQTPGLPIRSENRIAVDIGDDGVARMRVLAGEPNDGFFGDTKLW